MFRLFADRVMLTVESRERLTAGSVNVFPVQFEFSPVWDGLEKTAVFRSQWETRSVLLDESGQCEIPWETLSRPGSYLMAGVRGTRGEDLVLPTVWANLGAILPSASTGGSARPPTPELWEQELDRKGDNLNYTLAGELGLYSGSKLLSAVPISGGGGEGGVSDHRLLSHRDDAAQHPIGAVEGLQSALDTIPAPVEALTNQELEELLK